MMSESGCCYASAATPSYAFARVVLPRWFRRPDLFVATLLRVAAVVTSCQTVRPVVRLGGSARDVCVFGVRLHSLG